MKYLNYFLCAIVMILLSNCSSQFVVGHYRQKNWPHNFTFNTDSTFKYEYSYPCYKISSGTWRQDGNNILLNSFNQIDKFPVTYRKVENDSRFSHIHVNVLATVGRPQGYKCVPVINNCEIINEEKGSSSFISIDKVDSIYFMISKLEGYGYGIYNCFDNVETELLRPEMSEGESIEVTINIIDSLFRYRVFDNTELKVKGKQLIFHDEGQKFKLRLKKD